MDFCGNIRLFRVKHPFLLTGITACYMKRISVPPPTEEMAATGDSGLFL